MSIPSQRTVLEYAKRVQRQNRRQDLEGNEVPFSREEMKAILEAKFLHGQDYDPRRLPPGAKGEVDNPVDWLRGMVKIGRGVLLWLDGDKANAVRSVIDGVLTILY